MKTHETIKLIILGSIFFMTSIGTVFANGYYNSKDSGLFFEASGGLAQTKSETHDTVTSVWGTSNNDITFPSQSGGAAALGVGYKWSFGQKENWNQFYFGTSANYYYFGKAIDPINSITDNNKITSTSYTQLQALDGELFIGKYLASPVSVQLGLGLGGGRQGLLTLAKLKVGYDITNHLQVFATYISAGFSSAGIAPFGFINVVSSTGISVNSEQIGLEYTF